MKHPIYRIRSFEHFAEFTLRVEFDDNSEQVIDFSPILIGEMYGPLRDPQVFHGVVLDPEVHTLVWPNGADFDPATLHDWPSQKQAFIQLVHGWADSPVNIG